MKTIKYTIGNKRAGLIGRRKRGNKEKSNMKRKMPRFGPRNPQKLLKSLISPNQRQIMLQRIEVV